MLLIQTPHQRIHTSSKQKAQSSSKTNGQTSKPQSKTLYSTPFYYGNRRQCVQYEAQGPLLSFTSFQSYLDQCNNMATSKQLDRRQLKSIARKTCHQFTRRQAMKKQLKTQYNKSKSIQFQEEGIKGFQVFSSEEGITGESQKILGAWGNCEFQDNVRGVRVKSEVSNYRGSKCGDQVRVVGVIDAWGDQCWRQVGVKGNQGRILSENNAINTSSSRRLLKTQPSTQNNKISKPTTQKHSNSTQKQPNNPKLTSKCVKQKMINYQRSHSKRHPTNNSFDKQNMNMPFCVPNASYVQNQSFEGSLNGKMQGILGKERQNESLFEPIESHLSGSRHWAGTKEPLVELTCINELEEEILLSKRVGEVIKLNQQVNEGKREGEKLDRQGECDERSNLTRLKRECQYLLGDEDDGGWDDGNIDSFILNRQSLSLKPITNTFGNIDNKPCPKTKLRPNLTPSKPFKRYPKPSPLQQTPTPSPSPYPLLHTHHQYFPSTPTPLFYLLQSPSAPTHSRTPFKSSKKQGNRTNTSLPSNDLRSVSRQKQQYHLTVNTRRGFEFGGGGEKSGGKVKRGMHAKDSRVIEKGRGQDDAKVSPFIVNEGNYSSFATISDKGRISTSTHKNSKDSQYLPKPSHPNRRILTQSSQHPNSLQQPNTHQTHHRSLIIEPFTQLPETYLSSISQQKPQQPSLGPLLSLQNLTLLSSHFSKTKTSNLSESQLENISLLSTKLQKKMKKKFTYLNSLGYSHSRKAKQNVKTDKQNPQMPDTHSASRIEKLNITQLQGKQVHRLRKVLMDSGN